MAAAGVAAPSNDSLRMWHKQQVRGVRSHPAALPSRRARCLRAQVEVWQNAVPNEPPAPYLTFLSMRTSDAVLPSLVADDGTARSKPDAAEGVAKAAAVVALLQSRALRQAPGNAVSAAPMAAPSNPPMAAATMPAPIATAVPAAALPASSAPGASCEMVPVTPAQQAQMAAQAHAAQAAQSAAAQAMGALPPGMRPGMIMPGQMPAFVCGPNMAVPGSMAQLPDGTMGYIPQEMMGGMPLGAQVALGMT
jgi:hypothetical protein